MIRLISVLAIAVTLSVGGAIGLADQDAPDAGSSPGVTGDLATGLPSGDLDAVVAGLQTRLQELPGDAPSWATLALAYVEQARTNGDATLYAKAAAAVRRSMAEQPEDNAGALAAAAALAAARHQFDDALEYAGRSLAVDPYQPTALAIRIDALTELGRYGAQLKALEVADRRQPGLPVTTRYSYAFELRGQLARASALLDRAGGVTTPADQAYVHTLLADLDRRRGRLAQAAEHLRTALTAVPGHVPAMVSRARLAVAQGRLDQAVRHWEQVVQRLPLPEYLTELGELRLFLGEPELAEEQFAVVDATNQLLASNGVNTDLESALFEADHGSSEVALTAARTEWQRRHSVHVADVLGWALHRSGQDAEALRYARSATRLGTAEGRFWLHRGTIEAALGLDDAARTHLRQGLRVDPGMSPWQAEAARQLLGEIAGRQ